MSEMDKIRYGPVIRVRRSLYGRLLKVVGDYAARYGVRITYSDVIETLLSSVPNVVEVVHEYLKRKHASEEHKS